MKYQEYKENPLWEIVDKAINDLVENDDIVETTARDYIVGYIVEKILKSNKRL